MCIGGVGYYMHASHQPYFETVCHILHYLKGAPVICYLLSVICSSEGIYDFYVTVWFRIYVVQRLEAN